MKIGVLIYTYNRIDDARINMEIVRKVWRKSELLKDVIMIHSFNGEKEWWPGKYLEDEVLFLSNPGHFTGAELLLNEGVKAFTERYSEVDYVIALASDSWCLRPEYVESILLKMQAGDKYLATCAWGTKEKDNIWKIGMGIDFFIFNVKWATTYGLFPIRFSEFVEKHSEVFSYRDELIYLERVFALRFKQAISKSFKLPSENLLRRVASEHVCRMTEREPVHVDERKLLRKKYQRRAMYWPEIGLVTYHEPLPKREILRKMKVELGEHGDRLLNSADVSYYNKGITKTAYTNGASRIDYGD